MSDYDKHGDDPAVTEECARRWNEHPNLQAQVQRLTKFADAVRKAINETEWGDDFEREVVEALDQLDKEAIDAGQ